LGAGWNEAEFGAFGFPYDHRVSRFEEAFAIIRGLLRDGHADAHGDYYTISDLPLLPPPHRPGGPPLMVGSIGERMLAITLPHVDAWNGWHLWFGNSVEGYLALRERIDAACRSVGRDPAEVDRTVALLLAFADAVGRPSGLSTEGTSTPISAEDPEALAATLREFAAAGVAHVQLVLDPITVDSITALKPMLDALDR
jgi:alkanesulfonate monooxygenase SsuD/methylene tetrahydromethanopterin reductase-like flavin-dependent oxidoreductase (luciferase family)